MANVTDPSFYFCLGLLYSYVQYFGLHPLLGFSLLHSKAYSFLGLPFLIQGLGSSCKVVHLWVCRPLFPLSLGLSRTLKFWVSTVNYFFYR